MTPARYNPRPMTRRVVRQGARRLLDPRLVDDDGAEVRLLEVAVVVRFLFSSHEDSAPLGNVPQPRLLGDALARREHFALPRRLVLDGPRGRCRPRSGDCLPSPLAGRVRERPPVHRDLRRRIRLPQRPLPGPLRHSRDEREFARVGFENSVEGV